MKVSSGVVFGKRANWIAGILLLTLSACATSDKNKLKDSRNAFLRDDFAASEAALYTPEVYKNDQNRLMHYYLLSSVAMSQGQYEKAAQFLNKARDLANSVRSQSGLFEWFSSDYRSNPIEYSYLHYELVMAYALLAQAGESPAWSTPEIKDQKGNLIMPAMNVPARKFSPREIADYKDKARAELRAWDVHLENLKRTYPKQDFYKEDLWARILASYVHSLSSDNNERRTGELLVSDAKKIFEKEFERYPSGPKQTELLDQTFNKLVDHSKNRKNHNSLFVVEAGVIDKYKIKRFHLGLTTLFGHIQDPGLRMLMERIGIQVILNTAPEFGLIMVGGALAGAVDNGNYGEDTEFEGPPRFFSEAVDRSFGFEIRFPTLVYPPSDTEVAVQLSTNGTPVLAQKLPLVCPLQEVVATELKNREGSEMFSRALRIGMQYLAILLPAIQSYREAEREGNLFKKLAVIAGFYISKKVIDSANEPDLRSWGYLPKLIASDVIDVKPGAYQTKVVIQNRFGKTEKDFGVLHFGNEQTPILRERIGDAPVLNHRSEDGGKPLGYNLPIQP